MKTAICNELFQGWPIERVFDYAASLGFEAVEIAPFTLAETVQDISSQRRAEIRRAARAAGVEIAGLHWLLAKPEGFYINHPDDSIRRKTKAYLKELITLCAELGGRVLVHGSPHQRTIQEGWDRDEAWDRARETWQACARAAGKAGVVYCLEALTEAETNFLTSFDQAHAMVQEIDHPSLKTMFDCRAISASARVPLDRALEEALATGLVAHVHINDPNGQGPGFGELKFAPLLKVLAEQGYQGYLSVEVFKFEPDPETIAGRSLGYLSGILEALGQEVRPASFT